MRFIPGKITRFTNRFVHRVDANSPNLLFTAGVTGMVGTVVLSSRATLKLEGIVDKTTSDLETAQRIYENTPEGETYDAMDLRRDRVIIYSRAATEIGKAYLPAIALGVVSIGCLTKAHKILNARNVALTAAYATLNKAFEEYRGRVVDQYGEEQDLRFRHGAVTHTVVEDTKKGPKKVEIQSFDPNSISGYARMFDESNIHWSRVPGQNLNFLMMKQQQLNNDLYAKGHLFLNEVYDELGFERTTAGQIVGWVYNSPGSTGDGYVDLGLVDALNQPEGSAKRDFVIGAERSVLLDFNVDGPIYKILDDQ